MPQTLTFTVTDKQLWWDTPNSPWKIATEKGDVFKAWKLGAGLQPGSTYSGTWDMVANKKHPEYPPEATILTAKLVEGGNGTGGGRSIPAAIIPKAQDQAHWDEVDIRRHTVTIACAMFAKNGGEWGQLLDEARSEWKGHLVRSLTPTVKLVNRAELIQDDWEEFRAT
jgi:hypothetical protein